MQFKDPATRKKILKLLAKDAKAKKGTKNSDRGGKSKGAQRGRKQSPEDSALGRETPRGQIRTSKRFFYMLICSRNLWISKHD